MRNRALCLILALCLALAGCGRQPDGTPHTRTVYAMDTVMNLTACGKGAVAA